MDTQVVGEDTLDNEWAVDCIKSHSGAKSEALFKILWKSGDHTWLPYYQITHLQVLTDYLELIGDRKISKLPNGHGWPPTDNPQIHVGPLLSIWLSTLLLASCRSVFTIKASCSSRGLIVSSHCTHIQPQPNPRS